MEKILSDKEQKKVFKKIASENPDKYYPTNFLRNNGFIRNLCTKCGKNFWTFLHNRQTCGEPECNDGFTVVQNNPSHNKLSYIGVWNKIVEVLEPRGYVPIKRYPVVSRWNPTTEFTIASIAAFQPYVVTGEVPPPAKKLIIPQFCLRFGDIENVGITGSHCTGFVMIGQHQFVTPEEWDQEQAFKDIYDFLVDGVGLDKSEFVVHEDAWAGAGCFGPCMEFFSRGVELFNQVYTLFQQTPEGPVGLELKVLDMGLGMERIAWFSQGTPTIYEAIFPLVLKRIRERTNIQLDYSLYNRFSQYSAFLNIDEVENMHEAWKRVGQELQMDPEELKAKIIPMTGIYSVAEHARSLLFAISDGKLPSNVGGGYNLRAIFRRAISFIDQFNWDIDLADVCEWHAEELKDIFPEISENLKEVRRVLDVEKQKYFATKEEAEKIVKRLISKSDISLEKLIELYDSNGINPEIIQKAAAKLGKKIVIPDDFYTQVISRHENQVQIHATHKAVDIEVDDLAPTIRLYFDDYLLNSNIATVLRIKEVNYEIEDENSEVEDSKSTIHVWAVILDESVAYPTSGGQIHDNGWINSNSFIDVVKVGNCIVHILDESPNFQVGDKVTIKIDIERRKILTQHHSATHIVNAAARKVLGNHVNQAGAKKTLNKAHLDITHFDSIDDATLFEIEKQANLIVDQNIESHAQFMPRAEAEQNFGMGVYQGGAVPGVSLRIVEIPGVDVEACGGTHVHNTKEVGHITMIKAQKIQDGIVRLTFTAGPASEALNQYYNQVQEKLSRILETHSNNLVARSQELLEKWRLLRKAKSTGEYTQYMTQLTTESPDPDRVLRELSREFDVPIELLVPKIQKLKEEWDVMKEEINFIAEIVGSDNIQKLIELSEEINEYNFISAYYPNIDNKILSNVAKNIFKELNHCVILLIGDSSQGVNFIAIRDPENPINLSVIAKSILNELNGKGGGKPDSVQGFIPNCKKTPEEIIKMFKKQL